MEELSCLNCLHGPVCIMAGGVAQHLSQFMQRGFVDTPEPKNDSKKAHNDAMRIGQENLSLFEEQFSQLQASSCKHYINEDAMKPKAVDLADD